MVSEQYLDTLGSSTTMVEETPYEEYTEQLENQLQSLTAQSKSYFDRLNGGLDGLNQKMDKILEMFGITFEDNESGYHLLKEDQESKRKEITGATGDLIDQEVPSSEAVLSPRDVVQQKSPRGDIPDEPIVKSLKLEDASLKKSLSLKNIEVGNEFLILPLEIVGKSNESNEYVEIKVSQQVPLTFDWKSQLCELHRVELGVKDFKCIISHVFYGISHELDDPHKLFDEMLELDVAPISYLFADSSYVSEGQNDETIIVFDPGGITTDMFCISSMQFITSNFPSLLTASSQSWLLSGDTSIVFDWLNQLKELFVGAKIAVSASLPLFVYSLDYSKIQLANIAKAANHWNVRRFNGLLDVYWKDTRIVVGELQDSFLAIFLFGGRFINGVVTSFLLLITPLRTWAMQNRLMFYKQGDRGGSVFDLAAIVIKDFIQKYAWAFWAVSFSDYRQRTEPEFFIEWMTLLSYQSIVGEMIKPLPLISLVVFCIDKSSQPSVLTLTSKGHGILCNLVKNTLILWLVTPNTVFLLKFYYPSLSFWSCLHQKWVVADSIRFFHVSYVEVLEVESTLVGLINLMVMCFNESSVDINKIINSPEGIAAFGRYRVCSEHSYNICSSLNFKNLCNCYWKGVASNLAYGEATDDSLVLPVYFIDYTCKCLVIGDKIAKKGGKRQLRGLIDAYRLTLQPGCTVDSKLHEWVSWLLIVLMDPAMVFVLKYEDKIDNDLMGKSIVSWCVLTSCYYQESDLKSELFGMIVFGTYARIEKSLATISMIQQTDARVDRQPETTSVDKLTHLRYSRWHWHFCGCSGLPAI